MNVEILKLEFICNGVKNTIISNQEFPFILLGSGHIYIPNKLKELYKDLVYMNIVNNIKEKIPEFLQEILPNTEDGQPNIKLINDIDEFKELIKKYWNKGIYIVDINGMVVQEEIGQDSCEDFQLIEFKEI
jgi:hypothetical protein